MFLSLNYFNEKKGDVLVDYFQNVLANILELYIIINLSIINLHSLINYL